MFFRNGENVSLLLHGLELQSNMVCVVVICILLWIFFLNTLRLCSSFMTCRTQTYISSITLMFKKYIVTLVVESFITAQGTHLCSKILSDVLSSRWMIICRNLQNGFNVIACSYPVKKIMDSTSISVIRKLHGHYFTIYQSRQKRKWNVKKDIEWE